MKPRNVLAFAGAFLVAAMLLAQATEEAKPKSMSGRMGKARKGPIVVPAADLKWEDIDPEHSPGVKIADLWGNHETGAHGAYVKFPAGLNVPLHTHTHDMRLAVVSGTFIHTPEGKPEVRLGPGSYLMEPGGYRHATECDKASECVFLMQSAGKFDIKPVQGAAAKK